MRANKIFRRSLPEKDPEKYPEEGPQKDPKKYPGRKIENENCSVVVDSLRVSILSLGVWHVSDG